MDPASIKAFKDIQFLKSQLEGLKAANQKARANDEFTDVESVKSRAEHLRKMITELDSGDAFVYTGGKQQKPEYSISADELAARSAELQETVRKYTDSLERVSELDAEIFRHNKKSKAKPEIDLTVRTGMRVIWDDSKVSPLKLDTYKTK